MTNLKKLKKEFTLIEALIVLSVMAILLSFLLPVIKSAKITAFQIQCANNLKQIGVTSHLYSLDNNDHLPAYHSQDYYGFRAANNTRGWQGHLAPYLLTKENNDWTERRGDVWMHEIANSEFVPWTYIVHFPIKGWGPFKIFICPSASSQDRVGTPLEGIPYSYMASNQFCGPNDSSSFTRAQRDSIRYSDIEDPSGKIFLWEGASRIGVPNSSPNYNSVVNWKSHLGASDDPLKLYWGSSNPEFYGYHANSPNTSNLHGNMHFLHDKDDSGQEGYQNNLFIDGHVERCHEWWLYLASPIIFNKKGPGLRPRKNGGFDDETYKYVSKFFY